MSSIALCMVVKDEIERLPGCLTPLMGFVDDIVIIDTGSTDGTPEMLRQQFGIQVQHGRLDEVRCLCKSDLRNRAYAHCRANWILSIDADERIQPHVLPILADAITNKNVDGYFGVWLNHLWQEPDFEDYKLFLFRSDLRKRGLIHENVQVDVREKRRRADWLPDFVVDHYPAPERHAEKTRLYRQRLECAVAQQPDWLRYDWFLGYMDYQAGNFAQARRHFDRIVCARPALFPVECLNAFMLSAEIAARNQDAEAAQSLLSAALDFHSRMAGDFEVAINFRLRPWLDAALKSVLAGQLDEVRAYRFAR